MSIKPITYSIYTDGAYSQQLGIGACAFVMLVGESKETFAEMVKAYGATTSNRMELAAPLWAMQTIPNASIIRFFSDSQYVVKGMNDWVWQWVRRDWCKGNGDPVQNVDLWKALIEERKRHFKVSFTWVKGHNGNIWNERCDLLAETAVKETAEADLFIDAGYKQPNAQQEEEFAPEFCPCGLPVEDGYSYCGAHR